MKPTPLQIHNYNRAFKALERHITRRFIVSASRSGAKIKSIHWQFHPPVGKSWAHSRLSVRCFKP